MEANGSERWHEGADGRSQYISPQANCVGLRLTEPQQTGALLRREGVRIGDGADILRSELSQPRHIQPVLAAAASINEPALDSLLHSGRFRYNLSHTAPSATGTSATVMRATPRGSSSALHSTHNKLLTYKSRDPSSMAAECSRVLRLSKRKPDDENYDDDGLLQSCRKKLLTEEKMAARLQELHIDGSKFVGGGGASPTSGDSAAAQSLEQLEELLELSDDDNEKNDDDDRYPKIKLSDTLKETLKAKRLIEKLPLPKPSLQLVLWRPREEALTNLISAAASGTGGATNLGAAASSPTPEAAPVSMGAANDIWHGGQCILGANQDGESMPPVTTVPLQTGSGTLQKLFQAESRTIQEPLQAGSRTLHEPFQAGSRTLQEPFQAGSRTLQEPFQAESRTLQEPFHTGSRTLQDMFSLRNGSIQLQQGRNYVGSSEWYSGGGARNNNTLSRSFNVPVETTMDDDSMQL